MFYSKNHLFINIVKLKGESSVTIIGRKSGLDYRIITGYWSSCGFAPIEFRATVAIHGTTPTSNRAFDEADFLQAVAEQISSNSHNLVVAVHGI
ncbi:MAG: hypothetical protein CM1200mP24_10340 [Gammaproteobacteria bacterium]|nr:MAG: hypothetical protein CM1200mP24_10340 [Gammaproteobacteria bacterium]